MKRHDGISALIAAHPPIEAPKPVITPGAGVDPNKVIRPSKRVKTAHRSLGNGMSLKEWARQVVAISLPTNERRAVVQRWLVSKGVRP